MSWFNTEKARRAGYSKRRRQPKSRAGSSHSRNRNDRSLSPVRRTNPERQREYDQERGHQQQPQPQLSLLQAKLSSDMPHLKTMPSTHIDREVLVQDYVDQELDLVRDCKSWHDHGFALIGWVRHPVSDAKDTVGALIPAAPDDPTGVLQEVDRRTGHSQYAVPITLHPNGSMHVGWDLRLSAAATERTKEIALQTVRKNADIGLRIASHLVKNNLSSHRAL